MSREAFGDPPERQDVPECCPNCGSDFYMPGCTHCATKRAREAMEAECARLRAELAAERERCAKLCDDISDEYQRTEGRRYPELKSDAQEGAATCAYRIRAGA